MMTTTDNARWGRIPAWWLDHSDLDADGFAVLAALATFADEHGVCWPSQSTLAAKLKRSRPTINRILQRLDDLGLVSIEHRRGQDGARLSCRYRLRLTPDAIAPVNRDDSALDAPCPPASQEQIQPEQIPDSLAERRRGPVCAVPLDWMPGAVDVARHVEGFVLRCQVHGYHYRDVGAAWRAWLMQDAASGKAPVAQGGPPPATLHPLARSPREGASEQRLGAWMAASVTALPDRSPQAFDPVLPPQDRQRALTAGLPDAVREALATGRIEHHPRFREDGFDGLAETWSPPPSPRGRPRRPNAPCTSWSAPCRPPPSRAICWLASSPCSHTLRPWARRRGSSS